MPDIFIVDDQQPEDVAMLQALYSRSPASVIHHLDKLKASGSGKFMEQYYVGYGHASIGDCGTTSIFIEQVSILVAKAFQDTPLYNGQEASTRYLDFSKQTIVDPYDGAPSSAIQKRWMTIYNKTLPLLVKGLEKKYPFDPTSYKNEKIWNNTLKARAFDIARSLLPVGTTTLLSWTTSLRAARDHLRRLKNHPLPEVRHTAKAVFDKLIEKYPHSFNPTDMDEDTSERNLYAKKFADHDHFSRAETLQEQFDLTPNEIENLKSGALIARRNLIDLNGLNRIESATLLERPKGAALPKRVEAYGRYNFLFLLDFGSYRDIQRHRNGMNQIPLINGSFGLHPWYKEQFAEHLDKDAYGEFQQSLKEQFDAIADIAQQGIYRSSTLNQYLYPLGMQVLVHVCYSLPETVYVGELRSAKTVHPSLRPVAQKMLQVLEEDLPDIALYGDYDAESWTAKRGEQTITPKP